MTKQLRKFTTFIALLGMTLVFIGCSDNDNNSDPTGPEGNQNNFPTVQGITISPNAPIFADDTVTLTPVTTDADNDLIRYTWMKNAGTFDPVEAVGDSIEWTAPSTRGTYNVTVVGDDGNGGTSQRQIDLIVYGGDQTGTVDVVGGIRANPVGGTINLGYVDSGDTITLVWDGASPITTDGTRPDETKYAPDGSRLDAATLVQVSPPQFGAAEGLPATNAARYSIIARIGDNGSWFAFTGADTNADGILDTFTAAAPARGKLYLSINEQQGLLADNTGYWRMGFTISHP